MAFRTALLAASASAAGTLETQTPVSQLSTTTPNIKHVQCHTNQNARLGSQAVSPAHIQLGLAAGPAGQVKWCMQGKAGSRRRGLAVPLVRGEAPARGPGHPERHLEHAVHAHARHEHSAKGCRRAQRQTPVSAWRAGPRTSLLPQSTQAAPRPETQCRYPVCDQHSRPAPGASELHPAPRPKNAARTSGAHGTHCRKQARRVRDWLLCAGHAGFACGEGTRRRPLSPTQLARPAPLGTAPAVNSTHLALAPAPR